MHIILGHDIGIPPPFQSRSQHKETAKQLEDSMTYLKEVQNDPEMAEFTREEIQELQASLGALESSLKLMLLPKDPLDDKNIMLEIRAGAGGDEASIWTGDLYRMYLRQAPVALCTQPLAIPLSAYIF